MKNPLSILLLIIITSFNAMVFYFSLKYMDMTMALSEDQAVMTLCGMSVIFILNLGLLMIGLGMFKNTNGITNKLSSEDENKIVAYLNQ